MIPGLGKLSVMTGDGVGNYLNCSWSSEEIEEAVERSASCALGPTAGSLWRPIVSTFRVFAAESLPGCRCAYCFVISVLIG